MRCWLEEPASAINSPDVGQNAEPEPDLIAPKLVATQPRHLYRLLALLSHHRLYAGRAIAILRATASSKSIRVHASAAGLADGDAGSPRFPAILRALRAHSKRICWAGSAFPPD
jgi:hypothetical protein